MTELKNIRATHVLDRHEAQADLATQVRDIVGGKEKVTRIYDGANWTSDWLQPWPAQISQANGVSSIR